MPIAPTGDQSDMSCGANPDLKVACLMPNMPAQVELCVSGYVLTKILVKKKDQLFLFFKTFGDAHEVSESMMTAVPLVAVRRAIFIWLLKL